MARPINRIQRKVLPFLCGAVLLASGCAPVSVGSVQETYTEAAVRLKENAAVMDLPAEAAGAYPASPEEQAALTRMTLRLENEYLALYMGTYFDIAVLDKQTGAVFFSNRLLSLGQAEGLSGESAKYARSQVQVELYGKASSTSASNVTTLASYPDCFKTDDAGAVEVTREGDTLRVLYRLGQRDQDKVLFQAFTKETYDRVNELAAQKVEEGVVSRTAAAKLKGWYNHLKVDRLSDANKKTYIEKYPKLEELGELYVIQPDLRQVQKDQLDELFRACGLTKADEEAESERVGNLTVLKEVSAYIELPVIYQLDGRDLVASIETAQIVTLGDYVLSSISLLDSFGANLPTDEGYAFLPDGSGMIVENDREVYGMNALRIPFYGTDFGRDIQQQTDVESYAALPVFGMKTGNRAFFAVVEGGEALAGVKYEQASAYSAYNLIRPVFTYHTVDAVHYGDKANTADAKVFSNKKIQTALTVRYHFLYGDGADYAGMARYYQRYLVQTGALTGQETQENGYYLDLGLVGSITRKERVLGVPVTKSVAMTTFEQAATIVEELEQAGIDAVKVRYQGALNGGLDYKDCSRVSYQTELGGLAGYNALAAALDGKGIALQTPIDFMRVYKRGNLINSGTKISQFLNKSMAIISPYDPTDGARYTKRASYLVDPLQYDAVVDAFLKGYASTSTRSVYVQSVGSYLAGNYNEDGEVTRQEAMVLLVRQLQKLEEAGLSLTFDSGNSYVLPYATRLTGVPVTSSETRLESRSVPFMGMVLKGYMEYSGPALSQAGHYQKTLLQTIESGAGLNYLMMAESSLNLTNTDYTDLYSLSKADWMETIVSTYQRVDAALGFLRNVPIVGHREVQAGVNEVTYENGARVLVNYGETAVDIDGVSVAAMDFAVVA